MQKPNKNITEMPYAKWLEEILHDLVDIPMRSIAISGVTETGDFYTNYFRATMGDKVTLAGMISQDAMLDTLAANGVIEYDEDESEEEENTDGSEEDEDFGDE